MRLTKCQRLHVDVTVVPGGDAGTRTRRALLSLSLTATHTVRFDVLLGGERSQPRNTTGSGVQRYTF